MPVLAAIDTPRPSCVAGLDADGRLVSLTLAGDDDALLQAIPDGARVIAVDAPLVVPNDTGQRPVDGLLAWLDAPVLPASRRRLHQLFGGMRGVDLRAALRARADRVVETFPDLVLRELAWERDHPADAPAMPLAEYRGLWLAVRPPRYRPKGLGRAVPGGRGAAASLLASAVDLNGWLPAEEPDDWHAIRDAAQLDAIAAAYAAWCCVQHPDRVLLIGDPETPVAVPSDANLRGRAELHRVRLGLPPAPEPPD